MAHAEYIRKLYQERSIPRLCNTCTAHGRRRGRAKSLIYAGKLTVQKAGLGQSDQRRPRAENPEGPAPGGEKGGPGRRPKAGLPGEGGDPAGEVLGGQARPGPAARQPGGIWGGGVPSDDGTGGNGKA